MKDFKTRFDTLLTNRFGIGREEIRPEATFNGNFGADSLDMVELIIEFENEFQIAIPDDMSDKIQTVQDAQQYLESKLNMN